MSSNTRDFAGAMELVEGLYFTGIKLGLENTTQFLAAVGNPQKGLPCVHVAGTNGKGSVCAMLHAALVANGLRVGLFTSPHLCSLRERFRINGEAIPEHEFADVVFSIRDQGAHLFTGTEQHPTFFEFMTVLGLTWFHRREVDIAIIEVGMGGRLDATNLVEPLVTVITNIDLDHTKSLGESVGEIAGEKAGIIKPTVPIVSGATQNAARSVIRDVAERQRAPLWEIERDFTLVETAIGDENEGPRQRHHVDWQGQERSLTTRLLGRHQGSNAAVAWATLNVLAERRPICLDRAVDGMARALWPGRMQVLAGDDVVDAAHNSSAMAEFAHNLGVLYPGREWHALFGTLRDKDWQQMLTCIVPFCARITVLEPLSHRAEPAANVVAYIAEQWPNMPVVHAPSLASVLDKTEPGRLIVGSMYLVGAAMAHLQGNQPQPVLASTPNR